MIEIYYIEDDENIAMTVKEYLSQKGYAVSIFETLESGRKALEHHIPNIALIDWNMPDGEGNSFCRWIHSRWKELPVIFLTVRDDTRDIISGFEYGADDYVTNLLNWKCCIPASMHYCAGLGMFRASIFPADLFQLIKAKRQYFVGKKKSLSARWNTGFCSF